MEDKLRQSGFTPKEVKFISHWVEKENSTYDEVLGQLRRIFIFGFFIRLLIVVFCIHSFFDDSQEGFYSSLLAGAFVFVVAEVFAPFKVGAKVFIYLRRNRST